MKEKNDEELIFDTYTTYYALYATRNTFDVSKKPTDEELHCAWCHKTVTEIGRDKLDKHLEDHDQK